MEVSIHWFIARDGRQHGPVSDMEMRKLVELGHLRQTDLLWRQGFPDWRPAPAVFASAPPTHVPSPMAVERTRQPSASPTLMPRFEATGGRGAMQSAAATAAATAASHGSPMVQGGWQQPGGQQTFNSQQPDWRATQNDPRTGPQFIPAATQPQRDANFDSAPSRTTTSASAQSDAAPPRSKAKRALAAILVVATLTGGGWYAATRHGSAIKGFIASKTSGKVAQPTAEATVTATATPLVPEAKPEANSAQAVTIAAAPPPPPEKVEAIGAVLQQSAHWKLVAAEFPDWYREKVDAGARLSVEGKSEADIAKSFTKALALLRQSQAEAALNASSGSLRDLAVAFKNTVASMAKQGTPVCMSFITSGETSDAVAPVIADPAKNAEINAHFLAVFTAVAEGRKAATQHADPVDGDYKVLVGELVKAGWTQSELELFADPKGANRAAPERYCQMMQDFFAAHLSIADPAIQDRLLHRTLKLVVAG